MLHSNFIVPFMAVPTGVVRVWQVNTTLTCLNIDGQNPPIGAMGEAALLAALQVRQWCAYCGCIDVLGLDVDLSALLVGRARWVRLCVCVGRLMWA
jgi:hypothetical protein